MSEDEEMFYKLREKAMLMALQHVIPGSSVELVIEAASQFLAFLNGLEAGR